MQADDLTDAIADCLFHIIKGLAACVLKLCCSTLGRHLVQREVYLVVLKSVWLQREDVLIEILYAGLNTLRVDFADPLNTNQIGENVLLGKFLLGRLALFLGNVIAQESISDNFVHTSCLQIL